VRHAGRDVEGLPDAWWNQKAVVGWTQASCRAEAICSATIGAGRRMSEAGPSGSTRVDFYCASVVGELDGATQRSTAGDRWVTQPASTTEM
jgi:hypothetical protein